MTGLIFTFRRELLWAVYGCIQALENTGNPKYLKLARSWQNWLDYAKSTVAKVRIPFNEFINKALSHPLHFCF